MKKNCHTVPERKSFSIRNELPAIAFYIAVFPVIFLAAIFIISCILFFLHIPVNPLIIPASLIITAAALWFFIKQKYGAQVRFVFFIVLIAFVVIAGAALTISSLFYDSSWDGQDYHQPAVIALAGGWNPVYQEFPLSVTEDSEVPIWINHYPKANWILAANIYKLTGFIETGKSINIIFLFITFFLVLSALLTLKLKQRSLFILILLSLSIAGTSVFYYQFLSFYVDSLVSCLVISQYALCVLILLGEKNPLNAWILALLILLCANMKFTAPVFSFGIAAGLLVFDFIKQKNWRSLLKTAGFLVCVFCFAFVVTGFNPYVTNTVKHGHPLYPVFGNEKINFIAKEKPENIAAMNAVQSFCYSLFSESGTGHQPDIEGFLPARLKIPFTVKKDEIQFLNIDPRTGGFGVMFSGMLLLSLLLLLIHLTRLIRQKQTGLLFIHTGIIVWLLATVLVIPEAWWARYVPHFWIFPFMVVVLAMSAGTNSDEKQKDVRKKQQVKTRHSLPISVTVIGAVILILGFINNGLILNYYLDYNVKITAGTRNELDKIAVSRGRVALLAFRFDAAVKERLYRRKIAFFNIEYFYGNDSLEPVACSTTFGSVMFGIPLVPEADLLRLREADMPADTTIIQPADDIPESARAFSGIWKGKILGIVDAILLVKQIHSNLSAEILFSLGKCSPYKIEKQQYALTGQIRTSPVLSLFFSFDNADFTFYMDTDSLSLELIAAGNYTGATGYIRKIDPAQGVPYNTFTLPDNELPAPRFTALPLPPHIVLKPPAASLPDAIKGLAGRWEGKFGNIWEITVIVERISAAEAVLIFSWENYNQVVKGFYEINARVVNSDPPELYCIRSFGKLRFIPGVTGDTMEVRLIDWNSGASAVLKRRSLA